ncbi:MAG: hypothetical protein BMS9Abin37_1842 [Acidobacteriota bacterium]|nr:MAG: hypothetical protein BMS9Abin37_1842 [Acidobacteriota bacterium]
MKRGWLAVGLVAVMSGLAAGQSVDDLPEEDRVWLEEEVVYIITDMERKVFLMLETNEERARFKTSFWQKRDPNRATVVNEFQEEHYKRIAYANQFLGRETNRPGWATDRGRFYIIAGEPRQIQRFDSDAALIECELWFYQGDTSRGMPAFFYLIFFKRNDVGEYHLYYPNSDGPTALLRGQGLSGTDNAAAVERLQQVSTELARASLTISTRDVPDYLGGTAALGAEIAIAQVLDSPKRAIRTDYAEAHLRYGDRVSADYSFNFVRSRSYFAVLVGPERTPFVHYSIELDSQDFSFETDEDQSKFYTTLDVSLEIRDLDGKLLVTNDKSLSLELTPSQARSIGSAPIAYQDDFPLVPGKCLVSVILRNRVRREYAVAEKEIDVPDFSTDAPMLSDLMLGYGEKIRSGEIPEDEHRTFQIGATLIETVSDETFVIGGVIYAAVQAVAAGPDDEVRLTLRTATANDDATIQSWNTPVSHHPGGLVVQEISLLGMDGGRYELVAELVDADGRTVSERSSPLTVSPRTTIQRPGFVYRRGFNPRVPGLLSLALGEQLWARGRQDEALKRYQSAVAANNQQLPMANWKLAGALIQLGQPERALELLQPLEAVHGNRYEVVAGLGFAFHQKGDYAKAASYLARAATIRPPDTTHWNVLGDSYQHLGELEKAREAFGRSLKLDPNQEKVKTEMASLDTPH